MSGKRKLLIVEDDLLNQRIYRAIFSKDYDLTICGNDLEFDAALSWNTYELFIIDLALNSDRNGIDLIKELRNMNKYKIVPILVVTAYAFRRDEELSMLAGATKFITKPFDKEILLREIKQYFN